MERSYGQLILANFLFISLSESTNKLRIIFLGTPDFAVASLEALCNVGHNVVAVVTAPDKPAGRGMELRQSAVKVAAINRNIPVLQPLRLKDPTFIEALKSFHADLQVVVAFRMLPEAVWNMPPMGTINVHASLLPQYRGAAPINWVVINGETETGVTTFKLQHEIDTGHILLQEKMPIAANENAGALHNRMMLAGANLLVKTLEAINENSITALPQTIDNTQLKHAPKIFTETCLINWNERTQQIYNLVRGLSPYPSAFTFLDGKKVKIFAAEMEILQHNDTVGSVHTDYKSILKFATTDGYLHLLSLQVEGKKRMAIDDFLRGYRPSKN